MKDKPDAQTLPHAPRILELELKSSSECGVKNTPVNLKEARFQYELQNHMFLIYRPLKWPLVKLSEHETSL